MLLHHIAGHTATSSSRCSVRLSAPLPNVAVRVTSFNAQQCRRPIVACTSPVSSCSANSHRVHRRQQRSLVCRSTTFTEPLPEDLQLELNSDAAAKEVTYDEETKTVRIPLAAVGDGQRRTKMVMFTCNKCGGRSARLVNPVAWERGAVFCQCQHCEVWHTLAAHPSILEEIRYNNPEWQLQQQGGSTAAAGGSGGLQEGSQDSSETVQVVVEGSGSSQDEISSAAAAAFSGQQEQDTSN